MELIKNKKGIFFTVLVIVILSLFVLSFTVYSDLYARKTVEKRITTMNSFLSSTEIDLSRKMYIFGYRTIFLSEKRIIDSGGYLTSFNSTTQEAFFNGTINQQPQDLLIGVAYNDIINDLNQSASKINVNVLLKSPIVKVEQTDPWTVSFTLTSNLQMHDEGNLASWNKNISISANISIENFGDPLYYMSTAGLVANNITKTPFANFVSGANISNLSSHALNSYYKASTMAPSFIQRLEGKNVASPLGIESLVNLQRLSQQGVTVNDKSVVDYIYFSSANPLPLCSVSGMPAWFKIDQSNAAAYNISC